MGLLILLLLLILCSCNVVPYDAKPEARQWAEDMGYKNQLKGVACTTIDSDHDGYVSCSVALAEKPEPIAIECRTIYGAGCKVAIPKVRVSNSTTVMK